jgi:hypothetical protein
VPASGRRVCCRSPRGRDLGIAEALEQLELHRASQPGDQGVESGRLTPGRRHAEDLKELMDALATRHHRGVVLGGFVGQVGDGHGEEPAGVARPRGSRVVPTQHDSSRRTARRIIAAARFRRDLRAVASNCVGSGADYESVALPLSYPGVPGGSRSWSLPLAHHHRHVACGLVCGWRQRAEPTLHRQVSNQCEQTHRAPPTMPRAARRTAQSSRRSRPGRAPSPTSRA